MTPISKATPAAIRLPGFVYAITSVSSEIIRYYSVINH
nr:MAG TPA: hypothetical protein [Caudoviricetes sp.]